MQAEIGQDRHWQASRNRPDQADAAARAERGHGRGGQQYGQQGAGCPRPARLHQVEERQHRGGHPNSDWLDPAELAGQGGELRDRALAGDRHAGHPPELAPDHDQRHAGHVADEHGPGQQVRHEAESQQPGGN